MFVIGLTGGTGAGKSTALAAWRELGAYVIDCDEVYHELLRTGAAMLEELRGRFPKVFSDGKLNRKKLGEIVFQDKKALNDLNGITHKYVSDEVERRLRASGAAVAAIDAIELFSSGIYKKCDLVVGITAPAAARAARLVAREGITEEYAKLRVSAQKPEAYFKTRCDYMLENHFATPGDFAEACKNFYKIITERKENMEKVEKKDEIRDSLFYTKKNGYDRISKADLEAMEVYSKGYKHYLDASKTERQAVKEAVRLAVEEGFAEFVPGKKYNAGDKVYMNSRGKYLILAVMGKKSLAEGSNIMASHIDSPRLDLKQVPLYEDNELAYFKTHYYGGIRKYQWVTIPLALHGVVALKDGTVLDISIGDGPEDPQFVITDLLPHLAADQAKKPLGDAFPGESMNLLIGSRPDADEGSDKVKLTVMKILNEKYGIVEEDFLSAELEAVPAFNARDIGLDRTFIGSYGHDDRVCAYATLMALFAIGTPDKTAVCILADKEEVGSDGVSGMQSQVFETFMQDLCDMQGVSIRRCFENSFCVSADVAAGLDPAFPEVTEKMNTARMNYGLAVCKYTGSRGKSGTNDTSAEVVSKVRTIFEKNEVIWQTSELGKVDQGGGGTVAKLIALRNIDTIDAGVPVFSMHAPYEIVSKLDCYMAYKGYKAVYEA